MGGRLGPPISPVQSLAALNYFFALWQKDKISRQIILSGQKLKTILS